MFSAKFTTSVHALLSSTWYSYAVIFPMMQFKLWWHNFSFQDYLILLLSAEWQIKTLLVTIVWSLFRNLHILILVVNMWLWLHNQKGHIRAIMSHIFANMMKTVLVNTQMILYLFIPFGHSWTNSSHLSDNHFILLSCSEGPLKTSFNTKQVLWCK